MLDKVVRPYVPVHAFTRENAPRVIVSEPDVGLRWGNAARFSWSSADREAKASRKGMTTRSSRQTEDVSPKYFIVNIGSMSFDYETVWNETETKRLKIKRLSELSFNYGISKRTTDIGGEFTQWTVVAVTLFFNLHPTNEQP